MNNFELSKASINLFEQNPELKEQLIWIISEDANDHIENMNYYNSIIDKILSNSFNYESRDKSSYFDNYRTIVFAFCTGYFKASAKSNLWYPKDTIRGVIQHA